MIPGLRRKFIVIAAGALFAVIAVIVLSINGVYWYQCNDMLDHRLTLLLQEFPKPADPQPMMGMMFPDMLDDMRFSARGCVLVLNEQGELLSVEQDITNSYSEEEMGSLADDILGRGTAKGWRSPYKYRVETRVVGAGEQQTVIGIVDASVSIYSMASVLLISVVIALISFFLVLLIIIVASGRAVKPIAESYEKQKRFITDAGHELKTPLTVISANNEIARLSFGESEWFDSVDKQVQKMNGLVRSLIAMAKMDEVQKLAAERFNLSDAVYDTVKSFEHVAKSRGRKLAVSVEEHIFFEGEEFKIRQVTSILMDNAVKYCDEGGCISVTLTAGKQIHLTVSNPCKNLSECKLERLFERFYRADKARSSDGSFGLGLSIAKSIVEMHHGTIRARALHGSIIQFEIVFRAKRFL